MATPFLLVRGRSLADIFAVGIAFLAVALFTLTNGLIIEVTLNIVERLDPGTMSITHHPLWQLLSAMAMVSVFWPLFAWTLTTYTTLLRRVVIQQNRSLAFIQPPLFADLPVACLTVAKDEARLWLRLLGLVVGLLYRFWDVWYHAFVWYFPLSMLLIARWHITVGVRETAQHTILPTFRIDVALALLSLAMPLVAVLVHAASAGIAHVVSGPWWGFGQSLTDNIFAKVSVRTTPPTVAAEEIAALRISPPLSRLRHSFIYEDSRTVSWIGDWIRSAPTPRADRRQSNRVRHLVHDRVRDILRDAAPLIENVTSDYSAHTRDVTAIRGLGVAAAQREILREITAVAPFLRFNWRSWAASRKIVLMRNELRRSLSFTRTCIRSRVATNSGKEPLRSVEVSILVGSLAAFATWVLLSWGRLVPPLRLFVLVLPQLIWGAGYLLRSRLRPTTRGARM
jgi:hypothetical protein